MLTELKAKYNTDKEKSFLEIYERYFSALKDKPITMLEIGVHKAGSLLMWKEYFQKGRIVGLDINKIDLLDDSGRLKIYQGEQQNPSVLKEISDLEAPLGFDIIIDDAAHIGDLSRKSFEILFEQHLKSRGLYIIEDWGTGYWPTWPDGKAFEKGHNHGMVGLIKDLVDQSALADITHPARGDGRNLRSSIQGIYISHGVVVIEKV